jgi:hypothetical protein
MVLEPSAQKGFEQYQCKCLQKYCQFYGINKKAYQLAIFTELEKIS